MPLGLAGWLGVWYALFRLIWAFHAMIHPEHRFQDFWRSGIGFSGFVLSFLMLLAPAPGALCLGFALANCGAWLIAPVRRPFDREAVGYDGAGFAEATSTLFSAPPGCCSPVSWLLWLRLGCCARCRECCAP